MAKTTLTEIFKQHIGNLLTELTKLQATDENGKSSVIIQNVITLATNIINDNKWEAGRNNLTKIKIFLDQNIPGFSKEMGIRYQLNVQNDTERNSLIGVKKFLETLFQNIQTAKGLGPLESVLASLAKREFIKSQIAERINQIQMEIDYYAAHKSAGDIFNIIAKKLRGVKINR